jgi:hypothetical protein
MSESKWGGISGEAVKAKTGRDWNEWIKALDKEKAHELPHKEIAEIVAGKFKIAAWWSQMVTVGYEQAKGLREVNQTSSGYAANASKTINVSLDELWPMMGEVAGRKKWITGKYGVSKATPPKSLRIKWHDGSRVEVNLYAKGEAKSSVQVQHTKLADADAVAEFKSFWTQSLTKLKELLEA